MKTPEELANIQYEAEIYASNSDLLDAVLGDIKLTDGDICNGLKDAFLAGFTEATRWRNVEEELPKPEDGIVLVGWMDENGKIFHINTSFKLADGYFAYNIYPTHWRPIY